MRPILWLLTISGWLLLLSGCARSSGPISPSANAPTPAAAQASPLLAPIRVAITIDPVTLTAVTESRDVRSSTANDDQYLLSMEMFRATETFRVVGVDRTAYALDLTWEITHPFPAPSDPTGVPNGSTNRADLGVSGVALVLAEVDEFEGHTYFSNRIVNTELVRNADGYWSPDGLLPDEALLANTFPYQCFVDESGPTGSRVGVSNDGLATGNYGADGWTCDELGTSHDAWTGYGVLHQGQRSRRTLSLSRDVIEQAGPVTIELALILRYTDPRAGTTSVEKRSNRLPPATPDHRKFAYRMPHGAWDLPRIIARPDTGGFIAGADSTTTFRLQVEDWDTYATPTSRAQLSDDADVSQVVPGAEGLPHISLCMPGLLGGPSDVIDWDAPVDLTDDDLPFGGDPEPETGLPGDALYFTHDIAKPADDPLDYGTFHGLIRVIDPEVDIADPAYLIELKPDLTPLTSRIPKPDVFQVVETQVQPLSGGWARLVPVEGGISIHGDGDWGQMIVTPQGVTVVASRSTRDIDFGGGNHDRSSGVLCIAAYDPLGNFLWNFVAPEGHMDAASSVACAPDGSLWVGGVYMHAADYGLGPLPSSPDSTGLVLHFSTSGELLEQFTVESSDGFGVRNIACDNAGRVWIAGLGDSGQPGESVAGFENPYSPNNSSNDVVVIRIQRPGDPAPLGIWATGTYRLRELELDSFQRPVLGIEHYGMTIDGRRIPTIGNGTDCAVLRLSQTLQLEWIKSWGPRATGPFFASGLAIASDDSVYFACIATETVNFGSGPKGGQGYNACIVKIANNGLLLWDQVIPHEDPNTWAQWWDLAMMPSGDIVALGNFYGTVDFGGGLRDALGSRGQVVLRLTPNGEYVWDTAWPAGEGGGFWSIGMGVAADDSIRLMTHYSGISDFDPGTPVFELPYDDFSGTRSALMRVQPYGGW